MLVLFCFGGDQTKREFNSGELWMCLSSLCCFGARERVQWGCRDLFDSLALSEFNAYNGQ